MALEVRIFFFYLPQCRAIKKFLHQFLRSLTLLVLLKVEGIPLIMNIHLFFFFGLCFSFSCFFSDFFSLNSLFFDNIF